MLVLGNSYHGFPLQYFLHSYFHWKAFVRRMASYYILHYPSQLLNSI